MLCLAQFLMNDTEIVGTANQVHAAMQRLQARSCVPALARQARQPLLLGALDHRSNVQFWPDV